MKACPPAFGAYRGFARVAFSTSALQNRTDKKKKTEILQKNTLIFVSPALACITPWHETNT